MNADLRAAAEAATPGPWEQGHVWLTAGVNAKQNGEGKCAYCEYAGEPVKVGRMDINDTMMLAHVHHDPNPYQPDHLLSGPDESVIVGNYDYEAGGILNPEDTQYIALASPDRILGLLSERDELRAALTDLVKWASRSVAGKIEDRVALLASVDEARAALEGKP